MLRSRWNKVVSCNQRNLFLGLKQKRGTRMKRTRIAIINVYTGQTITRCKYLPNTRYIFYYSLSLYRLPRSETCSLCLYSQAERVHTLFRRADAGIDGHELIIHRAKSVAPKLWKERRFEKCSRDANVKNIRFDADENLNYSACGCEQRLQKSFARGILALLYKRTRKVFCEHVIEPC